MSSLLSPHRGALPHPEPGVGACIWSGAQSAFSSRFGYSRLKVEEYPELRVSGQKEGWRPNPGDLFPVVFLYLPQRGPWGAAHRRGTSRRPRGGPSGQPRRQRLRGLRRSPRAGPVLSPVRFAELLILRRGRDSSRSRVACFRGSGSVRASRWGRASAFQGRLLSF